MIFLAQVFSPLSLIYILVNRNFRSFHSIAFRVTTFIRGITALKDSLQGTFVYSHGRSALSTFEKAACVRACMHSVLSLSIYAPLPCVNAAWHWQEKPSEAIMRTAADPQTAGDKSRPWVLCADDHSVLWGASPHMPGRAASPNSPSHIHPSSLNCREGLWWHYSQARSGVPSPRGGSWRRRVGSQDNASLSISGPSVVFFYFFSILSTPSPLFLTLFDLELWPLLSHQNVSQGGQNLQRSSYLAWQAWRPVARGPAHHSNPGNKSHCICILIFHINKGPEYSLGQHHWTNLIRNEKFIGPSLMRLMLS